MNFSYYPLHSAQNMEIILLLLKHMTKSNEVYIFMTVKKMRDHCCLKF